MSKPMNEQSSADADRPELVAIDCAVGFVVFKRMSGGQVLDHEHLTLTQLRGRIADLEQLGQCVTPSQEQALVAYRAAVQHLEVPMLGAPVTSSPPREVERR